MRYRKPVLWGAGLMLFASAAGTLFGPSPLMFPLAPFLNASFATMRVVPGLADLMSEGVRGGGFPAATVFIVWTTALGALAGLAVGIVLGLFRR